MINLKIKTNGTVRNLTLPYPGQSIPDIIEKNSVVTVSEVTEPESLKYMEGHEWNIEEINFLAKRMESFDKREKRQFDAIASQLKPSTGQDLINQTFNLSRYTLISDFSSLTEIGKTHIINRKQAMSFDEMASTDFAKIGKDLIESGKGIPTAYGVMFINEDIPMDIVYNGKHFPEYDYKGSLATVAVTCKGETEYLYLPCSIQDINHALTKLPAKTWEECECTLESSNFPAEDWNENSKSILANEGVYCLNNVCEAVRRLHDESDFEKLSAAMQMADVDDSGSIAVIANQLSDFIYEGGLAYDTLVKMINDDSLWEDDDTTKTVDVSKYTKIYDTNFLQLIRKEHDETIFTNLFHYYLSQNSTLRDQFVKFLLEVESDDYSVEREKVASDKESKSDDDDKKRAMDRMDLWLEGKENIIIIENKIKSGINGSRHDVNGELVQSQLSAYYNYAAKKGKKVHCFIFAPNYNEVDTEKGLYMHNDKYKIIRYRDIYNFFNNPTFVDLFKGDPFGAYTQFVAALSMHIYKPDEEMEKRFVTMIKA